MHAIRRALCLAGTWEQIGSFREDDGRTLGGHLLEDPCARGNLVSHPGPEQAHVIGSKRGNWVRNEHADHGGQHNCTDKTFSCRMT